MGVLLNEARVLRKVREGPKSLSILEEATAKRDSGHYSALEKQNSESAKKIDNYHKLATGGGYLSNEDLIDYSNAVDTYIDISNRLRNVSRQRGLSYTPEEEVAWEDGINSLRTRYNNTNAYYMQFNPTEDQAAEGITGEQLFNQSKQEATWYEEYQGMSYGEIKEQLDFTTDPELTRWLTAYSSSIKTEQDYDNEIDALDKRIDEAKADLDRYNNAVKNLGYGAVLEMIIGEINDKYGGKTDLEAYIESLKAERWKLQNGKEYDLLVHNADFEEQSKNPVSAGPITLLNFQSDFHYNLINGFLRDTSEIKEDGNVILAGLFDIVEENLTYLTLEEKNTYNYLYNTQGVESAEKYLKYLKNTLSARAQAYTAEQWNQLAKQLPVQTSIASIPLNLWSGIGYLDVLGQKTVKGFQEHVTGEYAGPINYNSAAMLPNTATTAIRGTVAQELANKYGVIDFDEQSHPILSTLLNGKSWGDVYQAGMSMADSTVAAVISPVLGKAGTLMLSGSAATQAMLTAVENGATDEQALWMGALSGAFEYLFEKYELESLIKNGSEGAFRAFVIQSLSEGFGEGATTIANMVADAIIMSDKSELNRLIATYMDQNPNMTLKEATQKARMDMAVQLGWDVVGGALSGAIMGAGSSVIQKGIQNDLNSESTGILGKTGLPLPTNRNFDLHSPTIDIPDGTRRMAGENENTQKNSQQRTSLTKKVVDLQEKLKDEETKLSQKVARGVKEIWLLADKKRITTLKKLISHTKKALDKLGSASTSQTVTETQLSKSESDVENSRKNVLDISQESGRIKLEQQTTRAQGEQNSAFQNRVENLTTQDFLTRFAALEDASTVPRYVKNAVDAYHQQMQMISELESARKKKLDRRNALLSAGVSGGDHRITELNRQIEEMDDQIAEANEKRQRIEARKGITRAINRVKQSIFREYVSEITNKIQLQNTLQSQRNMLTELYARLHGIEALNQNNISQETTDIQKQITETKLLLESTESALTQSESVLETSRRAVSELVGTSDRDILLFDNKNVTIFNGKCVIVPTGLFDPMHTDRKGRSNLERLERGLAPIGNDNEALNIHHIDQTDDGIVVVIPDSLHRKYDGMLHSNKGQAPSQIDRSAFGKWRKAYWQWVLEQMNKQTEELQ